MCAGGGYLAVWTIKNNQPVYITPAGANKPRRELTARMTRPAVTAVKVTTKVRGGSSLKL